MATGVVSWSTTAATNATADSTVGMAEGMAPSAVNDGIRALMASVAKYRDDNAGSLVTTGTSTAYVLATNQVFPSLSAMNGMSLRVKFHTTNGATPTLNVDGLGAKALVTVPGITNVVAGALVGTSVYSLVYDSSVGQWVLIGASGPFPSGTEMLFRQTSAPSGWTKGSTHNDKALRVVTGTPSTGGSTAFSTVLASRTITQGNLPNVNLNPNTASQTLTHPLGGGSAIAPNSGASGTSVTFSGASTVYTTNAFASLADHTVTFPTVALGGSGTAMDFAVQYVDVILAVKD